MKIDVKNLDDLLVSAFRYALGRSTYIVSSIVEDLIANWSVLRESSQKLIVKEINQAVLKRKAGMTMDLEQWQKVIEHAERSV